MKICEIDKPDIYNLEFQGRVLSSSEREVTVKVSGESILLQETMLGDETGEIKLTTWGDKFNKLFSPGALLMVVGAYTKEFRGEITLSLSKGGGISVVNQ